MPPGPAAPPTETAAPRDVVHAVRAYAAEEPDRPAVKDAGTSLSYAQLLARVETSAGYLVRAGVTPGDRVGIHLPNSAEYIVAILACMTVGAVFVPIPYGDPEERIRGIAGDCDVTLTVVPTGHAVSEAARRALRPVGVGELADAEDTGDVENTEGYRGDRDGEDIVYLVYTSGTTGRPKGVMVRRAGLRNFVANTVEVFELTRKTRALCVSPFHFDGAFGSIFSVLSVGGSLVVAGHGPLLPGDFFRLLLSEGITHTSFSPSLLRLLTSGRDLPRLAESRLRTVGLGGEDCTPQQIAKLLEHRPGLRVFNRYGPTETTVVVATHLITREWCASGRKIPLGAPDHGVGFHLVDAEGNLVTEPDTPGELCVSGVQVMAGYWGAPEVTRQVLRDDLVPGTTVYRTGDLVRRTPDGLYVYLDRADNVVKRNGNRISMTEVTAALLDVPGVEDAVALVDRPDGRTLIRAFVVAPGLDAAPVRKELLLRVPTYMSPDSLHVVAELPRLSGGKPDARRLRALL
ncbi:amino acid adenylation domain-containing protein [Streptomyces sp. KN37]|uniref:amino acid adenylation domain-containing protein n=1 Tax=Streptomyces sp. KN37 TaxID=3090667 RepID=UPI002A7521C4|nr:amino acid adenylation domain-containing protein [Streptomyces sp. KN37]WPO71706.1 amino acid adenylation domain-containing protein [Streptomyces sp. KN37]